MSITYKDAGVDKTAGYKQVELIKKSIASTKIKGVLGDIGSFGGLFMPDLNGMEEAVLVSGTDGVGTKLIIAQETNTHNTIGEDLVAMSVNDVICQGAKPLFFLDYIACGKLEPSKMAEIVESVASGCRKAGCALIGGETAEMPDLYKKDEYDLAGFCVGIVDKKNIITGENIKKGDILLALPSSGIHSNGYSLVRKIIKEYTNYSYTKIIDGTSLKDMLLEPTRIYTNIMMKLIENFSIKGISHITGGGIYENIPRIMPKGLSCKLNLNQVEIPKIFKLLQEWANIEKKEMYSTFNMGMGMVFVVSKDEVEDIKKFLENEKEKYYEIGTVIEGNKIEII